MKSNSYADISRCWLVISCSFKYELNKFDYLSTQWRNIPVDDLMSSQNMIKQLHGSPPLQWGWNHLLFIIQLLSLFFNDLLISTLDIRDENWVDKSKWVLAIVGKFSGTKSHNFQTGYPPTSNLLVNRFIQYLEIETECGGKRCAPIQEITRKTRVWGTSSTSTWKDFCVA